MSYYYFIEYGLYLLVFLLPIQTRWIIKAGELNEYGTISLYGTDILLILLLSLFVIFKFQIPNSKSQTPQHRCATTGQANSKSQIPNPKFTPLDMELSNGARIPNPKFQIPKYWWIIAGLDLMIFISIFFAADKLVAVYRYGLFLLGVGFFWLIVSANYNKIKLVYSLLAGIFLQACLGIWQFLTQSSFACKWLGLAQHNAGDLGVSVVEAISSIDGIAERWLRAYGGLDHPNVLGGLLVVGLLLLIWLFMTNPKSQIPNNKPRNIASLKRGRQIPNPKSQIINLILLSAFCFLLSSLFFTFSRGAWLGLAVGIFIMLFIAAVKKNLAVQKKILEIILISGILIFILFNQYQDLVMTRVSADARLEVKSSIERIESYENSWQLIKDHWLFGAGIGNYTLGIRNYELEIMNNNAKPSWHYQPVHNVFLLIWAEIGILGLLFFISFLLLITYYLLFNYKRSTSADIYKFSLLIAIAVMFMIDHWWWSLHFGVLFLWLVLGLMLKNENKKYNVM